MSTATTRKVPVQDLRFKFTRRTITTDDGNKVDIGGYGVYVTDGRNDVRLGWVVRDLDGDGWKAFAVTDLSDTFKGTQVDDGETRNQAAGYLVLTATSEYRKSGWATTVYVRNPEREKAFNRYINTDYSDPSYDEVREAFKSTPEMVDAGDLLDETFGPKIYERIK